MNPASRIIVRVKNNSIKFRFNRDERKDTIAENNKNGKPSFGRSAMKCFKVE